jgi:hypothetical protein
MRNGVTRHAAIPFLANVTVASITTRIRGLDAARALALGLD